MTARSDLSRFIAAQDAGGTYAAALAELRHGRKTSHWMWFVFPQIAGLGRSATAQLYAVRDLAEARAYLADSVLGHRLRECCHVLLELPESDAVAVFGAIDAMKLRSSMTLFARAAEAPLDRDLFIGVLETYFDGAEDLATVERL
ncbi:DUF1810 domain-containing protein [Knoellia subterranea]|uniref:Calpastatin n=1 Tax=Knoellia subterranea KCTC 19937 TaxID=1385521 RepID=A0A0A0JGP6_9MICO|nr:DUF1810 domain-containing protein [Knoellia subterranea]KGN36560.1 calpastatin [Knoellia subterranea KCTC 19937]